MELVPDRVQVGPAPPVVRVRRDREGPDGVGRRKGEQPARLRGRRQVRVRDRAGDPLPHEIPAALGECEDDGRRIRGGDGESGNDPRGRVSLVRGDDGVRGERGPVRELRVPPEVEGHRPRGQVQIPARREPRGGNEGRWGRDREGIVHERVEDRVLRALVQRVRVEGGRRRDDERVPIQAAGTLGPRGCGGDRREEDDRGESGEQ